MNGGFSKQRLQRLHDTLAGHVQSSYLPGAVALISRKGTTHFEAVGTKAMGGGEPMRRDTIFRIASMTKPIAAVAAMILVEKCVLRLDESVEKWLPELANRRVLRSLDGPVDDTVPARRSITLRDLLTFRLGIGAVMVWPARYPIQKAIADAGLAPGPDVTMAAPDEWMKRLGGLPLLYQPGEQWLYHTGSDVLGVLIARASGKSLGDFLRERIFEPLGMKDTGFVVPSAKLDRLCSAYRPDGQSGELKLFDDSSDSQWRKPPAFESAGGGLVSTADDYLAFCHMMLAKGRHGSTRILSRPAVELMTTDQIQPSQKAGQEMFFGADRGWGFGMGVTTRREELWGSLGRFGWDGGYGTSAYSDPAEDMVGILLTQRMMDSPEPPRSYNDFWTAAYQAIDD